MINDPTINLETLVAYEGHMGELAQAARAQVQAMRAETPLSTLIGQARDMGPRPKLAELLHQDGFSVLDYNTEAMFDGPHDPSVAIMVATEPIHEPNVFAMEGMSEAALLAMEGTVEGELLMDFPSALALQQAHGAAGMGAIVTVNEDADGTDQSNTDEQVSRLEGTIFKLTNAGQGPRFQQTLSNYVESPRDVVICDEIVVDPWQLWRAKAMGFSAVILPIGAQVTPVGTNRLRVCEEVGLEWILKADYTHQIDEGIVAYQDAFVSQPPLIALGLALDGEQITHQKVLEINTRIPLPDGGHYLPFIFAGDKFLDSLDAGTNPVVNAYQDAGLVGGIAVDSTIRRFFSGQ